MPVRPLLRLSLVGMLLAALVAALVWRSWVAAQARAFVVLSVALDPPGLGWAVRVITPDPLSSERTLAGVPASVVHPDGDGPWPTIVFVNGATERGRRHPHVQQLARGLARAGYMAVVPDVHGLARGEITERTLAETVAVARAAAGRVALVGVSVGASLALLAAADPALAGRVSVVAGLAPYADLRNVVRLATTETYETNGHLLRYRSDPFLQLAVARSLAAALPPGGDRRRLLELLSGVDTVDPDPLASVRRLRSTGLGPPTRTLVDLLRNRSAKRFAGLYEALPRGLRQSIRRLSPLQGAGQIRSPVELASAPRDDYFPLAESQALVRRVERGRLSVTSTLDHAVPDASLDDVADLLRLEAFVVRVLREAR